MTNRLPTVGGPVTTVWAGTAPTDAGSTPEAKTGAIKKAVNAPSRFTPVTVIAVAKPRIDRHRHTAVAAVTPTA